MAARGSSLMGAETEYGLALVDRRGKVDQDEDDSAHTLFALAKDRFPHLRSADGQGIFLQNGGKLYVDVGGHIEFATPECASPRDLVRYTLAGDRVMGQVLGDYERKGNGTAMVFRGNVSYGGQPTTWGTHESYHCLRSPEAYASHIVPFLVSRMIFCGGGGLDPFSPGVEFSLSPRSHFIQTVVNTSTTSARPIFNLRDEPLGQSGSRRLHIICGDALGSETAMWLRAGTTALVVSMLDAGCRPGDAVSLRSPVAALRAFASDSSLTRAVPTVSGGNITALEIQRHYLEAARKHVGGKRSRRAPVWAPEIIEAWDKVLAMLEVDAELLDTVLDWRIKRRLYMDFCESNGTPWDSLPAWNSVLKYRTREGAARTQRSFVEEMEEEPDEAIADCRTAPRSEGKPQVVDNLSNDEAKPDNIDRVRKLRSQLFELDMRFLQIGGIFSRLEAADALNHRVISEPGSIDRAVSNPPSGTRAAVRGCFVSKFARNPRYSAGWTTLVDERTHQKAPLDDPFATYAQWSPMAAEEDLSGWASDARATSLARFLEGDYEIARALQQELLESGFEPPSTLCHLARIALVTDDFEQAAVHTRRALQIRGQAPSYITVRIYWLLIALSMLGVIDQPLESLLQDFKTALYATYSYAWSVEPVVQHLRGKITAENYHLLAALAEAISNSDSIQTLESFAAWREAGE